MFKKITAPLAGCEWLENQVVRLPEVVNVETVPTLFQALQSKAASIKTVDFVNVKQADSVALALLLNWQNSTGLPITVLNLPDQLKTLVKLYSLEGVVNQS